MQNPKTTEQFMRRLTYPFLPTLRTMYAQLHELVPPQRPNHILVFKDVQIRRQRLWKEFRPGFVLRKFGDYPPFVCRHYSLRVLGLQVYPKANH